MARGLREIALEILQEFEGVADYSCEWSFDYGACEEENAKMVEKWKKEIDEASEI